LGGAAIAESLTRSLANEANLASFSDYRSKTRFIGFS
jgi:hypothetical protein